MNSRSFLNALRTKQRAGNLPQKVSLTNEPSLVANCPEMANGNWSYLNSLKQPSFNGLLHRFGLPQNIFACDDMDKLVNVLDELVNNSTSAVAAGALVYGNQACRPALCYFLRYLLGVNGITI